VDKNFTLLDPGDEFQAYKILKMLNKDKEGIKYIAERDGIEYVLKIFYQSSFQNMHTLMDLQMRLSRLSHLESSSTARVREVNQKHTPAYMAVEYIHGSSLADIKRYDPKRIDEALLRRLCLQMIEAAKIVRKHGLTLANLTLNGIMLDDNEKMVILSSGISYQNVDEHEDIFTLGTLCAQLLSQNPRYHIIYSEEMLRRNKFAYIGGVSLDLNKVLSECLHRNVSQRYRSLDKLEQAITKLPALEDSKISEAPSMVLPDESKIGEIVLPKFRIEIGFWALVIGVIAFLAILFSTGLYDVIFGAEDSSPQSSFVWGADSVLVDTPELPTAETDSVRDPVLTPYGELRNIPGSERQDPRRIPAASQETDSAPVVTTVPKAPPSSFVYIEPSTFGFGRLGENQAHNVSLSDFYISKYEVTQAEWNRFMKPAKVSLLGDKIPVDNVSWYDIAIYANGLSEAEGLSPAYRIRGIGADRVVTCDFTANGYRLPTEAEWELAAKAGQIYNYSGSNDPAEVAWHRDNSAGRPREPGSKAANDFGLYDMTGNVSEWVWDWYDANHIRALTTFVDPTGPESGSQKVIRGGNVMNGDGRNLNIMWRERGDPNRGYPFVGFRLARTR